MFKNKVIIGIVIGAAIFIGLTFFIFNKTFQNPINKIDDVNEINKHIEDLEVAKRNLELAKMGTPQEEKEERYVGVSVPDGVSVTQQGESKLIKNELQRYQIVVPQNLIIAESQSAARLSFFDEKTYSEDCKVCFFMSIKVIDDQQQLSLEDWIAKDEFIKGEKDTKQTVMIDGAKGYRVEDTYISQGHPDDPLAIEIILKGYEFLIEFDNKIYKILFDYSIDPAPIINTLKFLN